MAGGGPQSAAADKPQAVSAIPGGFVLSSGSNPDAPHEEAAFAATVERSGGQGEPCLVSRRLVRLADDGLERHRPGCLLRSAPVTEGLPSPGGTLFVPLTIAAGATQTVVLRLSWYAGQTSIRVGKDAGAHAAAGHVSALVRGQVSRSWRSDNLLA